MVPEYSGEGGYNMILLKPRNQTNDNPYNVSRILIRTWLKSIEICLKPI